MPGNIELFWEMCRFFAIYVYNYVYFLLAWSMMGVSGYYFQENDEKGGPAVTILTMLSGLVIQGMAMMNMVRSFAIEPLGDVIEHVVHIFTIVLFLLRTIYFDMMVDVWLLYTEIVFYALFLMVKSFRRNAICRGEPLEQWHLFDERNHERFPIIYETLWFVPRRQFPDTLEAMIDSEDKSDDVELGRRHYRIQ